MSNASDTAISSSFLNMNIRTPSKRRSSSSFEHLPKVDELLGIIESLLQYQERDIHDLSVARIIGKLRLDVAGLSESESQSLKARVRQGLCQIKDNGPNTVGAFLCGCLHEDIKYGSLKSACTAHCANSLFSDGTNCKEKIIHWLRDPLTGKPITKVIAGTGPTCNIFVDSSANFTPDEKANLLVQSNCRTYSYFDAETNKPLMGNNVVVASLRTPAPLTAAAQQAPLTAATAAAQQAPTAPSTGAAATTPITYASGGASVWVGVGIVLFILLILIIAFAVWKYKKW